MATIKVSIKEEIVINGSDIGSENVFVDSSIVYADRRVMTVNAVGFEPIRLVMGYTLITQQSI